ESGAGALIGSEGEVLALASGVSVDVDEFRTGLATARRAGDIDEYRLALGLYQGELLPDDRYDDWANGRRRELHVEFLAGLTELSGLLEARGDLDGATDVVRRLVVVEPTREEGHELLIRLYALAGRRADALRQYEQLVQLLDVELGTE